MPHPGSTTSLFIFWRSVLKNTIWLVRKAPMKLSGQKLIKFSQKQAKMTHFIAISHFKWARLRFGGYLIRMWESISVITAKFDRLGYLQLSLSVWLDETSVETFGWELMGSWKPLTCVLPAAYSREYSTSVSTTACRDHSKESSTKVTVFVGCVYTRPAPFHP